MKRQDRELVEDELEFHEELTTPPDLDYEDWDHYSRSDDWYEYEYPTCQFCGIDLTPKTASRRYGEVRCKAKDACAFRAAVQEG